MEFGILNSLLLTARIAAIYFGLLDAIRFIEGDFNVILALRKPATVNAVYYLFPNPPRDYHFEPFRIP
jgi:hypothetical protein